MFKPFIIVLLEMHISDSRADEVCQKIGFQKWHIVEAQGFQGGIWILWNEHENHLTLVHSHYQFVTLEVKGKGLRLWLFKAVYASPQPHAREELWAELTNVAGNTTMPWLLVGDFNETKSLDERDHGGDEMRR